MPTPAAAVRNNFAMLAMSRQKRPCINNPDLLCLICGDYTMKISQSPVTELVQKAYLAYVGISKLFPHIALMKIAAPMMWRENSNHNEESYFCPIELRPLGTATKVSHFHTTTFLLCRGQCRTAMNFQCQILHISCKLLHSLQKGIHACQLRKEQQLIKLVQF